LARTVRAPRDLRILIATALSSRNLAHSDVHETAIDRIATLAFSDPLGVALWRLKYGGERRQHPRSAYLLAKRSKAMIGEDKLRWKLCRLVVDEWLDDACDACDGRRFILATSAEIMRVCNVCLGTGVKRHSDQSRMSAMHWDPSAYRKWESRLAALHQKIGDADVRVWRQVAKQLGWIRGPMVGIAKVKRTAMLRLASIRSEPAQSNNYMPEPLVSTASG
jgi:hypothetical protein